MSTEPSTSIGWSPSGDVGPRYLLRLSRPQYWWFLGGPAVVGAVWGANSLGELFSPYVVALLAYWFVLGNLFVYGINDVFDVETDARNERKAGDGPEQLVTDEKSVLLYVILAAVAALPFAPRMPAEAVGLLVLFFLLAVEYSAPPLRLKSVPFLDGLANCLYFVPGILIYVTLAGSWPPLVIVLVFALRTVANHAFIAVPDIDPDRAAGVRTTAVVLGERRTLGYCISIWSAAAVLMGTISIPYAALLLADSVFTLGVLLTDREIRNYYWVPPVVNFVFGLPLIAFGLLRIL